MSEIGQICRRSMPCKIDKILVASSTKLFSQIFSEFFPPNFVSKLFCNKMAMVRHLLIHTEWRMAWEAWVPYISEIKLTYLVLLRKTKHAFTCKFNLACSGLTRQMSERNWSFIWMLARLQVAFVVNGHLMQTRRRQTENRFFVPIHSLIYLN